jgi:hypothetical protein
MFAYCLNNPIILSDTTGNIAAFNTLMTDSGSKAAAPISARTSKKPPILIIMFFLVKKMQQWRF